MLKQQTKQHHVLYASNWEEVRYGETTASIRTATTTKFPQENPKRYPKSENSVWMQESKTTINQRSTITTESTEGILTIVVRKNNKRKRDETGEFLTVVMGALERKFVLCEWAALLLSLWRLLIRVEAGTWGYLRGSVPKPCTKLNKHSENVYLTVLIYTYVRTVPSVHGGEQTKKTYLPGQWVQISSNVARLQYRTGEL